MLIAIKIIGRVEDQNYILVINSDSVSTGCLCCLPSTIFPTNPLNYIFSLLCFDFHSENTRFKKCAMERIPEQAEQYANNLLPTLVDVAGVENENSELWKELLKIVFLVDYQKEKHCTQLMIMVLKLVFRYDVFLIMD